MSSNTVPKVVVSSPTENESRPQFKSKRNFSACLFAISYQFFKILLFVAIIVEILITVYEKFEPHNITDFQAMDHYLFGAHFTNFYIVSLWMNLFGLTALLAPITEIGGQVTLTLFFLFSHLAVFALLFVDLFRPEHPKECDNDEMVLFVSCAFLSGLKMLATRSLLLVAKVVSLVIGLVYLLQVMVKHGGKKIAVTSATEKSLKDKTAHGGESKSSGDDIKENGKNVNIENGGNKKPHSKNHSKNEGASADTKL